VAIVLLSCCYRVEIVLRSCCYRVALPLTRAQRVAGLRAGNRGTRGSPCRCPWKCTDRRTGSEFKEDEEEEEEEEERLKLYLRPIKKLYLLSITIIMEEVNLTTFLLVESMLAPPRFRIVIANKVAAAAAAPPPPPPPLSRGKGHTLKLRTWANLVLGCKKCTGSRL